MTTEIVEIKQKKVISPVKITVKSRKKRGERKGAAQFSIDAVVKKINELQNISKACSFFGIQVFELQAKLKRQNKMLVKRFEYEKHKNPPPVRLTKKGKVRSRTIIDTDKIMEILNEVGSVELASVKLDISTAGIKTMLAAKGLVIVRRFYIEELREDGANV